MESKG